MAPARGRPSARLKTEISHVDRRSVWPVAEAKAKLSEILRLARAGEPQTIGSEEPCVVISAEQYEQLSRRDLGKFLIETAPRGVELELPSRDGDRGDPFADF